MRKIEINSRIQVIPQNFFHRVAKSGKVVFEYEAMHLPVIKMDDYLFCRVRACSADVPNKNGDTFPYDELKATYHTFINKGVYCDHQTDSVNDMRGRIFDAVFKENEDQAWVELLIGIDKTWTDLCNKVKTGQITDVSMGCYVKEGICSVCGNCCKGETDEYGEVIDMCDHVRLYKNQYFEGELVHEECSGVEFIEISLVTDGADPQAIFLDVDIHVHSELPNNVVKMFNDPQVAKEFKSTFKKVASTNPDCFYLPIYDLPEQVYANLYNYANRITGNARKFVADNKCVTLGEALETLSRTANVNIDPVFDAISSDVPINSTIFITNSDVELINSLIDEYYMNHANPSFYGLGNSYSELESFVFGKLLEMNNGAETITDPEGVVTSVCYQKVADPKNIARNIIATRVQQHRQAATLEADHIFVSNINELDENSMVKITDSRYNIQRELATVLEVSNYLPDNSVGFVSVRFDQLSYNAQMVYSQDEIDSGSVKIELFFIDFQN